jgi:prevent-host-death family protein
MTHPTLDLEKDIQPVSKFRSNTAEMLKRVQESRRPIILTQHGRSAAVLLDVATYQAMADELGELRDITQGLDDKKAGRVVDHDEARAQMLERYAEQ